METQQPVAFLKMMPLDIRYLGYINEHMYITLWLFNIAMENKPFIDEL